ncbi:aspartyl aminopeptidase [Stackebrandtia endophytica]|uniref:M18 family aminopeptidase n=2 Tax=Stackebrandtia endophytica TaxID=1496996 RepID=A0A543AUA6_9ACTN|nr:M18 family aminopeptidase [Stackebrandtia endophytica]TQL76136.1 aspartyl aminopeptidase [Stackebrandtia endophytica]
MPRFDRRHTDDLISFVTKATSPYHAASEAAGLLAAAGFRQLTETDEWDDEPGGKYVIRAGALVAWYVPESAGPATGFRVFGAHTDSPTLKVKPHPDTGSAGWRQVGVEIYGGVPRDTWLDRDLGLSGRLVTRDGQPHLVSINRPLLRVPRLAIHLDRAVNDGQVLDAQNHMTPLWGLGEPTEGELIATVAATAGLDADDVVGWDLVVHDVQPPAYLGKDNELLACPRLDNLVSVHAGAAALAAAAQEDPTHIPVLAAFDHEETGSESYTGAGGPILDTILRRVLAARGAGVEDTARAFADSVVMSSDTGHAVHPNYVERHEPGHHPVAGGGPILKVNVNQRYASEGLGQAVFVEACDRAGVPWQSYVNRNSLPCGTTIGPITAAKLGVLTVDVGIAILSMHSSRELCGADDPALLADAATAFLTG